MEYLYLISTNVIPILYNMQEKKEKTTKKKEGFSQRFLKLRKEMGLSQQALSKLLGLSGNTQISKFENGTSEPNLETLRKIASLSNVSMGIDIHELVVGHPSPITKQWESSYYNILELAAKYISRDTARLIEERHKMWGELGMAQEKASKGIVGQSDYVDFLKREIQRIEEQISNVTEDQHYVQEALDYKRDS